MASRYHPELRWRAPLLRILPATTRRNLASRRKMIGRMKSKSAPGVDVSDTIVSHDGLEVPVRTYRPTGNDTPRPTLVWLHGGGLVMGTHTDDAQCSRFVAELGIAVASVDYRLAPEHPYPAAIDDILVVVGWLRANGADHGFDTSRLAIGGQSAGGGLTASAVQHLHDQGVEVDGQLLIYPMLDDRTVTRSDIGAKDHLVWNNVSNEVGWSSYLGVPAGSDGVPDGAVPARREDLTGLAPAWLGIGTADIFHDEDLDYARRLTAAGVDCELYVVEGMVHGFDMLVTKGEATRAFNASQDAFLRTVLDL